MADGAKQRYSSKRKATPASWKPGQSGNPKGRAPTGTAIAELFRGVMEERDYKSRKPRVVALAMHLYEIAMGDGKDAVAAGRALLEWSVPKPAQAITGDNGPIEIVIRRASEAK